jgi:hypothetical protein
MTVIRNAVGFYANGSPRSVGAFVETEDGMYWAAKRYIREGGSFVWSGSLPLPDTFRSQTDVNGTAAAMKAGHGVAGTAMVRDQYAVAWRAERGHWAITDILTDEQVQKVYTYYGIETKSVETRKAA